MATTETKYQTDFILSKNYIINPRTAGGLSHLRTAGGGGQMTVPPPRELKN